MGLENTTGQSARKPRQGCTPPAHTMKPLIFVTFENACKAPGLPKYFPKRSLKEIGGCVQCVKSGEQIWGSTGPSGAPELIPEFSRNNSLVISFSKRNPQFIHILSRKNGY